MQYMADLVLYPVLQVILEKLATPYVQKFHDLYHLKENIGKLQNSLPTARAFLDDAQKRQETDQHVENWLVKLKDIAYQLENLLDEFTAESVMCEHRSGKGKQVSSLFLPFEPSKHLFDLAKMLPKKLKELDEIAKQGFSLNLRATTTERRADGYDRTKVTGSFVITSKICGRDDDKKKLLELLLTACDGKTGGVLSIIPIVGIGGLGKTTLAQLVYNDEKIVHFFDIKIWVYVSRDFDVSKLMLSIIQSATKRKCELLEMDLLQAHFQDSLGGKRFLIVLDDVWNEDQEEWDKLGDLLQSGGAGSRIIVTTRSTKVASIVGTTSPYCLQGLTEDDCWVLFKQRAFSQEEEAEHPNLLEIGKQIIKKCGGVPLAAKTLGSLLRFKREREDWMFVQESELWKLENCNSGILPALRLSYLQLPLHLKRCFAFCSLYPKNYEIHKEKMIHIWIAEGLITCHERNRQLEDIGNEYFNDLLCLSFFQEVKKFDETDLAVYKMHDLIHDLARSVGSQDFVILGHDFAQGNMSRVHHLSILFHSDPTSLPKELYGAKHLRTLQFLFCTGDIPSSFPLNFKYLRVLGLSGCVKKVHESISDLICLRYLDLSSTSIQTLPHTICNLFNLQTLNLSFCGNLMELPFGLANITGLRHLNIVGCNGLTRLPAGLGNLVQLQTLPLYIVGKGIGESISEISSPHIRGELSIRGLENIRDKEEATLANMRAKKYVELLRLQWGSENIVRMSTGSTSYEVCREVDGTSRSLSRDNDNVVEGIIECLQPHVNLKKLYIKGYPGFRFPDWDLPNLVLIALINCRGCDTLPTFGKLPFLKTLYLQGMDRVTHIGEEFYGGEPLKFPSLEDLTIKDLPCLKEWSCIESRPAVFPRLQKLVVDKCPNLISAPTFQSLLYLELHDCHPKILESVDNMSSLSNLVIDALQGLGHLSGKLLENNKSLETVEILSCKNFISLPQEIEHLTYLKSLTISYCEKLTHLPIGIQKLQALEFLEINGCHSLQSLPSEEFAGFNSLKSLSIENCSNLIYLSSGFLHLTVLEQLSIMGCPRLTLCRDSFQNLSSLRSLSIISCPELYPLPVSLQHVTTLQSLVIHSSPHLTDLPDWLAKLSSLRSLAISNCEHLISLPEGMKYLNALQHLSIQDCPHLERLCKKKGANAVFAGWFITDLTRLSTISKQASSNGIDMWLSY
ncbi:hypothetical protein H5410_010550 [Solanum commersonii]|uniref:Disease resistance protein RGA3 n=1 Tax=Solanum commersonii TaxID=4109 RepID=A0A9J6ALW5_SOLCO|nr:hypothetical protein H5410_010550 [Solanum commersonii]